MGKTLNDMSVPEIFTMEPEILRAAVTAQFPVFIPMSIESVEDMAEAGIFSDVTPHGIPTCCQKMPVYHPVDV